MYDTNLLKIHQLYWFSQLLGADWIICKSGHQEKKREESLAWGPIEGRESMPVGSRLQGGPTAHHLSNQNILEFPWANLIYDAIPFSMARVLRILPPTPRAGAGDFDCPYTLGFDEEFLGLGHLDRPALDSSNQRFLMITGCILNGQVF